MIKMFHSKQEIIWSTPYIGLPKVVPIELSKRNIPEWFKEAPNQIENLDLSVKRCPGIIQFLTMGYVIPMWTDLSINIKDLGEGDFEGTWNTPSVENKFEFQTKETFINLLPQKTFTAVIKGISPWFCKTPKGVSMLFVPMLYHFNEDFETLTGIESTDIYPETNPFIALKRWGNIFIRRGTPLGMAIPIRREEFKTIIREETTQDNLHKLRAKVNISTKFSRGYRLAQQRENK